MITYISREYFHVYYTKYKPILNVFSFLYIIDTNQSQKFKVYDGFILHCLYLFALLHLCSII